MEKPEYVEVAIQATEVLRDPIMALLNSIGYEGFSETDQGLNAYIPASEYDQLQLQTLLAVFPQNDWEFETTVIPPTNWNAVWESNYPAVYVDGFCQIISGFHDAKPNFTHTILIDPKMSFGTGHHETTRLVVRHLQTIEVAGKQVLDMGCGTGILGILAAKLGAASVTGIDIDPWSYENGMDNARQNQVEEQLTVLIGDAAVIPDARYELILANINLNVLFQDLSRYVRHLVPQGQIVLSGFYKQDVAQMLERTTALGLVLESQQSEGDWVALKLKYQTEIPIETTV